MFMIGLAQKLPEGSRISCPVSSIFIRQFIILQQPVETRIILCHVWVVTNMIFFVSVDYPEIRADTTRMEHIIVSGKVVESLLAHQTRIRMPNEAELVAICGRVSL